MELYNKYNTIESSDYATPTPLVHASIGQKWGGGLYVGLLYFRVTTITDHSVLTPRKQPSKAHDTNS